jgi:hypothetical protein
MIIFQYGGNEENDEFMKKFVSALAIFMLIAVFPIAPIALVFVAGWMFFKTMIIDNIKKL